MPEIVKKATSSIQKLSGEKSTVWKLKNLIFISENNSYDLTMFKENSKEEFCLVVNSNGKIIEAESMSAEGSKEGERTPGK